MVNLNTEQSRQERVRRDLSEHLSFKWEAYPGDAVYTAVRVPDLAPPKGWLGRAGRAGNMALFGRGPSGAKVCARAAEPASRALETDANRLNRRLLGVHRTVRNYSRQARQPTNENAPDLVESWDVRRTALPRSLLTTSLSVGRWHVNGSKGLLWKTDLRRSFSTHLLLRRRLIRVLFLPAENIEDLVYRIRLLLRVRLLALIGIPVFLPQQVSQNTGAPT
jgi:hypothetical protein